MNMKLKICCQALLLSIITVAVANAGFIPKLPNLTKGQELYLQGSQFIGTTQFAGTKLNVFGSSSTTTSTVGRGNFTEIGFGPTSIDNTVFTNTYDCLLTDVYRLSAKEVDGLGRGYVELDLRFPERGVNNLHLIVLDLDEGSGSRQEQLLVNAYNGIESSRANKIEPRSWDILAQGDLSPERGANPANTLEVTYPPLWFTVNDATPNRFGLLQARKKSNQNRDYTVLTMPDAVTRLRLKFRASRGERNGEIGSHVYVGLWHDSQPCR